MKRWSKILTSNPGANNIFKFQISYTKTCPDNVLKNYTFNVNIPDAFAEMYIGERKATRQLRRAWDSAEQAQNMAAFYTYLSARIGEVVENYKYKWGTMLDANDLYFNPLYNVDGSEIVEETRGARKTTETLGAREDTNEYGATEKTNEYGATEQTNEYGNAENTIAHGNGSSHMDTIQHGAQTVQDKWGNGTAWKDTDQWGLDKTETTVGARKNTAEHKTKPYNETSDYYGTDKTITDDDEATDVVERQLHSDEHTHDPHTDEHTVQSYTDQHTFAAYTDKETRGTHTDTLSNIAHSDTLSEIAHTDTMNKGEQENVTESDEYIDKIETTRKGNIGVTKSTELLRSYMDLPTEYYTPILLDIMSILSEGY